MEVSRCCTFYQPLLHIRGSERLEEVSRCCGVTCRSLTVAVQKSVAARKSAVQKKGAGGSKPVLHVFEFTKKIESEIPGIPGVVEFARDTVGFEPDERQAEVLRSSDGGVSKHCTGPIPSAVGKLSI